MGDQVFKIQLKDFGRDLITKDVGENIFSNIHFSLSKHEILQLDFSGVEVITSICASVSIGALYVKLCQDSFHSRIQFAGMNEFVAAVIRTAVYGEAKKAGIV